MSLLLCLNAAVLMASCGDVEGVTTLKKVTEDTAAADVPPRTSSAAVTAPVTGTEYVTSEMPVTEPEEVLVELPDDSVYGYEIEPVEITTTATTTTTVTTTLPPVTTADKTPPVISVSNFTVYRGDSIAYKKYAAVSDNFCKPSEITVSVDPSQVMQDTLGRYPVYYSAEDNSGNRSSATAYVTIAERPADPETQVEAYVKEQARAVLSKITSSSMSQMQKAYAVWYWTRHNIGYVDSSDKSNYLVGARDGFRKRFGDCYTFFSVAKALLNEAGIQNVDVIKARASESDANHFWLMINVGDGWYHFDCTPYRAGGDNFFMLTDAELKAWDDARYKGCHNYSKEGMPEVSTVSVQSRVNYSSSRL